MEHCGPEEAVDELAELGRDPTWKQRGLIRRPDLYVHASDSSPADWRALAAQPAKGSLQNGAGHEAAHETAAFASRSSSGRVCLAGFGCRLHLVADARPPPKCTATELAPSRPHQWMFSK